jgi:hypothetical protein
VRPLSRAAAAAAELNERIKDERVTNQLRRKVRPAQCPCKQLSNSRKLHHCSCSLATWHVQEAQTSHCKTSGVHLASRRAATDALQLQKNHEEQRALKEVIAKLAPDTVDSLD